MASTRIQFFDFFVSGARTHKNTWNVLLIILFHICHAAECCVNKQLLLSADDAHQLASVYYFELNAPMFFLGRLRDRCVKTENSPWLKLFVCFSIRVEHAGDVSVEHN